MLHVLWEKSVFSTIIIYTAQISFELLLILRLKIARVYVVWDFQTTVLS
jgi:hypothetical protein